MNNLRLYLNPLFVVSDECLYCGECLRLAPATFKLNREKMVAYVASQPESVVELEAAFKALDACPVEAIEVSESKIG